MQYRSDVTIYAEPVTLVLIPRNYSRPRTEMRQTQDGCRRADQGRLEDKDQQGLDCDIDIGDGTVDDTQQDINDREVLGTSRGNVTESHRASTTMRTRKLANTEVKETIAKTNDKGNLGRDEKYKDGGAGLSKTVKDGGRGRARW